MTARKFFGMLAALFSTALCSTALAQGYPEKPITIILPLQAGSASDVAVRIVAERMAQSMKQGLPIENVTGASGLIGTERLVKARADGYTLAALNNSILTILPNIQKDKVKFDPHTDFIPIGGLANIPTLLGVSGDSPIRSVKELIDLARAKPGSLNYASGGPGSPQHLATEMFMAMAGVQFAHIPYKGATQAAAGLAGGQVQVMFIAHSLALPFLGSGKVRPIAFAGGERSAAFPNLPTVAELGVPGYDYSSWIALFAPKGTPADIVTRLRREVQAATAIAEVRERMAKSGLELWAVTAERLPQVIRDDFARWEKVVRTANIKAE
ncbi:MAG: tripartite tricarboxylate transporter substrate binding protein [Betaproteobacteria bacterium]|nr:tripartite tricarboxylate transporter substrate binding protein [Betaproteobacteria bacterium]